MKFSIIIIGYNQQAVICQAIKSAFEQSYKNLEVIYVDDASTDNSVEIIKHSFPDSRLRIIENHRNQGSSVARLLGIKAATGEWCLLVDGDDSLCSDACEVLHKTISEQDEETDIIGFGANIICSESVSKVSEKWIKDKASEPVLGSHSTRELLRIQYGTREKAWLLWNKCFRIDVLRSAAASAEYEVLYRLTDYYLCFLACCEGHRYYGIANQLYNYNYGSGISLQSLDLDGVLRYMSGHKVTALLTEYARKKGVLEEYRHCFESVEQDSVSQSIERVQNLPVEDRQSGARALVNTFDPQMIMNLFMEQRTEIDRLQKEIEQQAQYIQRLMTSRYWIKEKVKNKYPIMFKNLKELYVKLWR